MNILGYTYRWIMSFIKFTDENKINIINVDDISYMSDVSNCSDDLEDEFVMIEDIPTVTNDCNNRKEEEDFVIVGANKISDIPILTNEYIDDALTKYNYSEFIISRPENYGIISLYMTQNLDHLHKIYVDIYIYQNNDYVHIIYKDNTYIYDKVFGYLTGPDNHILSHFKVKPLLDILE